MTTVNNTKIKKMEAVNNAVYDLIEKYKAFHGYEPREAMDGDAVETMLELVGNIINEHEGNK